MLTYDERIALGQRFQSALLSRDWDSLRAILTDDASWVLPGDNIISGLAAGADAVVERAKLIASYSVSFTLEQVVVSPTNMALRIHNTAERNGLKLDEYLATVCTITEDGLISYIETYLSDVNGMNAFFV